MNEGINDTRYLLTKEEILRAVADAVLTALASSKKAETGNDDKDPWMDLEDLCAYIPFKPAKQTVYGYVNRKEIPFHKKSKKLYFKRSEIDKWLLTGKRQSVEKSVAEENDRFLSTYMTGKKEKVSAV